MAGTTMTCPVCMITYRIRYDNIDVDHELDYEDTPFYLKDGVSNCRKCELPIVGTWGFHEYAKKIYDALLKFDIGRLNDCIHKGYFSEAIVMLHIQIINQLTFLLLRSLPIDKSKKPTVERFFEEGKAYSLINLAFIYDQIDEEDFKVLINFNELRNKFVHSFKKRKKFDFKEIRELIIRTGEIEKKLSDKYLDFP